MLYHLTRWTCSGQMTVIGNENHTGVENLDIPITQMTCKTFPSVARFSLIHLSSTHLAVLLLENRTSGSLLRFNGFAGRQIFPKHQKERGADDHGRQCTK